MNILLNKNDNMKTGHILKRQFRFLFFLLLFTPLLAFGRDYPVFVVLMTGQTLTCEHVSTDTVLDIKICAEAKSGVPVAEQQLVYSGVLLDNSKTLGYYGIGPQSMVQMLTYIGASVNPERAIKDPRLDISVPDGPVQYRYANMKGAQCLFSRFSAAYMHVGMATEHKGPLKKHYPE